MSCCCQAGDEAYTLHIKISNKKKLIKTALHHGKVRDVWVWHRSPWCAPATTHNMALCMLCGGAPDATGANGSWPGSVSLAHGAAGRPRQRRELKSFAAPPFPSSNSTQPTTCETTKHTYVHNQLLFIWVCLGVARRRFGCCACLRRERLYSISSE